MLAALVLLIIGMPVCLLIWGIKDRKLQLLAGALVIQPFLAFGVLYLALECENSAFLEAWLVNSLSPVEHASLKPNALLCPNGYSYSRNGERMVALVVGEFFSTRVLIGAATSPR